MAQRMDGARAMPDALDGDPIVRALERSTIAQTLKAARASLAEPSRPYTMENRSLFQLPDGGGAARPTSSYNVDQLSLVQDTFGSYRPDTILEEEDDGYRREGHADILRLEDDDDDAASVTMSRRASPQDSDAAGSSGSEELSPVSPTRAGGPQPPRFPGAKPPLPPGAGYPSPPPGTSGLRSAGGYPAPAPVSVTDLSPRARLVLGHDSSSSPKKKKSDSPMRRKTSRSPAPAREASPSSKKAGKDTTGDDMLERMVAKLQSFIASKERRKKDGEQLEELCGQLWEMVGQLRSADGKRHQKHSAGLLREVMSLMDAKDLKDTKCSFKLARAALALLQMESATKGVLSSGVQAAYLNIAQVLFKYSQKGEHDAAFLSEGILEAMLEVLQSEAPECASSDLRVYIVGALKNVSNSEANQKCLSKRGGVEALFKLMGADQLCGNSKEAQLLIQITATLRNLANHNYKHFLTEDRLNAMTRTMALFPGHVELLTNVVRVLSKLTLHTSACEAIAAADAHIRQFARTLNANADATPLVLRLAFVLGNLTERSEKLRVVFAFDCEGTALVPSLIQRFWRKERQLVQIELDKGGPAQASSVQEIDEVLVKLVRLLANLAISTSAGSTLASSSAVVDPLLDMLGAKRINDSEELVLNVVAAITNLLFYDVPSNLFFQDENKQLLCRLFRPLLLESYNVEALVETARALGNLSRHTLARQCMMELRIDEILVILLDHEDRDLVFYVCGVLVNLAADPECALRLLDVCPTVHKLGKLFADVPLEDPALQLVAVKVLTNLSLDPGVTWVPEDVQAVQSALDQAIADNKAVPPDDDGDGSERRQLLELAHQLQVTLPTLRLGPSHAPEKE